MTADVNVTEKALNVAAQRFYEAADLVMLMTDKPKVVKGLHAALRSYLSDPEVLAGMAGVLWEARPLPCSWERVQELAAGPESEAQRGAAHLVAVTERQATALADWLRGQG